MMRMGFSYLSLLTLKEEKMLESKSTDKLMLMEGIIAGVLNELSESKREKVKACKITWKTIEAGERSMVPCPELELEFFE